MSLFGWTNRTKFRDKFIRPLLDAGLLAMTEPDKPRSSRQRYVATAVHHLNRAGLFVEGKNGE
jgi:ATP-dependent DNA helicase RecG